MSKKLLSTLLTLIILSSIVLLSISTAHAQSPIVTTLQDTDVMLGDTNGDGEISVLDATAIQLALVLIDVKKFEETAADTDDDSYITIMDATIVQRYLAALSTNSNIGMIAYNGLPISNDFVFIKDELWCSRDRGAYADIKRFKLVDNKWTLCSVIKAVGFGHWNTVDYCEYNDCLIFGNGGNSTETKNNYFCLVKNPLSLKGEVTLDKCALKIPVNIGFKVQALWADDNMGKYDKIFLISNYLDVSVAILKRNGHGDFSGEYEIVEKHSFINLGGMNGGSYKNGHLYLGGNTQHRYYDIDCSSWKGKIVYQQFRKTDDTVLHGTVQGIKVDDKYMWMNCNFDDEAGKERLIRKLFNQ